MERYNWMRLRFANTTFPLTSCSKSMNWQPGFLNENRVERQVGKSYNFKKKIACAASFTVGYFNFIFLNQLLSPVLPYCAEPP